MVQIAVVGSGYVGLVASVCFAELGHNVTCVDNDAKKIESIKAGGVPIHEQYLPELLQRHRNRGVQFTTELADAIRTSSAIFIAVGTPQAQTGEADLSYVETVVREIAQSIDKSDSYKVIIEKSTVPVLTSGWIRKTMLLNRVPEHFFDVASNPEFLREGTAVTDFLYPDRIVIGVDTEKSAELLREIYQPLTSGSYSGETAVPAPSGAKMQAPLIVTSTRSAELIKHASNAFLATKISFINAVANMCEALGADITEVSKGIGSDTRIGPGFLRPGVGYGGSCFPKDLAAFQVVARECGYEFPLLAEVVNINERQKAHFLRKVRKALWTLRGKKLGVLGLAFKGGTDDIRESPAIMLIQSLLAEGCKIKAYDPAAMENARRVLQRPDIYFVDSAYEAARGSDALLVLTDWAEFTKLDLDRIKMEMVYPIMVDGRNIFDPAVMRKLGFAYYSIGRPDVQPSHFLSETVAQSRAASTV